MPRTRDLFRTERGTVFNSGGNGAVNRYFATPTGGPGPRSVYIGIDALFSISVSSQRGRPCFHAAASFRIAGTQKIDERLHPGAQVPAGLIHGEHRLRIQPLKLCCSSSSALRPDKFCMNFMGDAAFGMTGPDVETAVRCDALILTVVLLPVCTLPGQADTSGHRPPYLAFLDKPQRFQQMGFRYVMHQNGMSRESLHANIDERRICKPGAQI